MIEITAVQAFVIYLALSIALILGIWFMRHLQTRQTKVEVNEAKLRVCEFCHFTYLARVDEVVTKCQRCQNYNKNNLFPLD